MSTPILTRFLVASSLFGLAVSAAMTLHPQPGSTDPILRKTLIGLAFSAICVLGAIAAFRPGPCSRLARFREGVSLPAQANGSVEGVKTEGHHPCCGVFRAHVLSIRGRALCAGCVGLSIGGLAAFAGAILYFFGNSDILGHGLLPFWFGALAVTVGLLQFWPLGLDQRALRFLANASFAFGAFLVVAKVDQLSQSLAVDLFVLLLVGLWILTRIALSNWNHQRICASCTTPCGWQAWGKMLSDF